MYEEYKVNRDTPYRNISTYMNFFLYLAGNCFLFEEGFVLIKTAKSMKIVDNVNSTA